MQGYNEMKRKLFKILIAFAGLWLFASPMSYKVTGKEFVVVIDAGHGGHDPGAVGKFSKEKNINLNVALQVGKNIQQNCKNVKVIYTRKTDVFIPLDKRAEIANNAKADLFISIHTNSVAKGNVVRGTETFTLGLARSQSNLEIAKRENSVILIEDDYKQRYAGFNPNSSESYIMFEFIQDKHMEQSVKLAKMVQNQFRNHASRIDRGVHQAGFLVLRATTMPSVLVELGYISTPDEEKYLNSDKGIETMGTSIYKAFLNYKQEHEKPLNGKSLDIYVEARDSDDTTLLTADNKKSVSGSGSKEKKILVSAEARSAAPVRTSESAAVSNDLPVFKIQFLASSNVLKKNDARFKGLHPVDYYKEKGTYKYTYGESEDYNKILRMKKTVNSKFKDAFIIAFKNGEKMDIHEAINEFKKNRK